MRALRLQRSWAFRLVCEVALSVAFWPPIMLQYLPGHSVPGQIALIAISPQIELIRSSSRGCEGKNQSRPKILQQGPSDTLAPLTLNVLNSNRFQTPQCNPTSDSSASTNIFLKWHWRKKCLQNISGNSNRSDRCNLYCYSRISI